MPEWRLLNARLTVFVAPDTVVPPTIWRDLVGEEPEDSSVQRSTATRIESGPFADGTLKLQIQPMRIDWAYEPVGLEAREGLPPFIGPFPAAADPLIQFGHRWAASAWFPSVSRVAVGFTLLSPTRDRETGVSRAKPVYRWGSEHPRRKGLLLPGESSACIPGRNRRSTQVKSSRQMVGRCVFWFLRLFLTGRRIQVQQLNAALSFASGSGY